MTASYRRRGRRLITGDRLRRLRSYAQSGRSTTEIGARLGLTRQRVAQLLLEHGLHDTWLAVRRQLHQDVAFARAVSHRRPAIRALFHEARAAGLAVTFAGETLLIEGLYVRVFVIREAWKSAHIGPAHPGYYRWQIVSPTALYVALFPEGGRRFFLPPNTPRSHEYVRADDPMTRRREDWPSRAKLRAAARAVVGIGEQYDRAAGGAA